MNIKEVERLSGMSRANIRFYEEKGLLAPARRENGYRDYSPQDVETLLRIRLLRSLQMPLEEIHALQTGEKTLDAALVAQAGQWERQCQEARRAQEICRAMRADGAVYATLDAKKYLNAAPAQQPPAPLPATDRAVYPLCPGRRYFARTLDAALCGLIWNAVLTLGFHCNLALRSSALLLALDTAAALLIMLALEPLFLHFFGTTPGKFLMGLRLEEAEGARLSLAAARGRTWAVLWQGCGLNAPIFRQYRLWKSYRRCRDGEISDWDAEYETAYIDCGMKKGGALLLAAAMGGAAALTMLCMNLSALPPCRSPLTVADFARNYNFFVDYYGQEGQLRLDDQGGWAEKAEEGAFVIRLDGGGAAPDWRFALDDAGYIREASFLLARENGKDFIGGTKNTATLGALAFLSAQPQAGAFSFASWKIAAPMEQSLLFRDVDYSLYGVHVAYQAEQQGYADAGSVAFPLDEENNRLRIAFSMTLE